MRHHLDLAAALGLALLLSLPSIASAEPSAAERDTARGLVIEGRKQFNAGDYKRSLESFRRAHAIMGVPTTGVGVAKALASLGQLVEAREAALEVVRMPATPNGPKAFVDAQGEASTLAEALAQRVPALRIKVDGPAPGAAVVVKIDGVELPATAMDAPRKVNPGSHHISASAPGFASAEQSIAVPERLTRAVVFTLHPLGRAATSAVIQPGAPERDARASDPSRSKGRVPAWAWVAGGAGVAAGVAAAVFAVDLVGVRGTISADCPSKDAGGRLVCDGVKYSDADVEALQSRRNRDMGLAIGLGAVGVVGVGVALVGILAAPRSTRARSTGAATWTPAPWAGERGAGLGVAGRF